MEKENKRIATKEHKEHKKRIRQEPEDFSLCSLFFCGYSISLTNHRQMKMVFFRALDRYFITGISMAHDACAWIVPKNA